MTTAVKHNPKNARCPRCGRAQPDMVISNGRLYTEPGHVLVIAYVCSGCERIVHWGKRGDGKSGAG